MRPIQWDQFEPIPRILARDFQSDRAGRGMAERDERGRLLPGHSVRKPTKRQQNIAIVEAFRSAFPPSDIPHMLREMYEVARKQNSVRGMAKALELAMAYGLGKPGTLKGEDGDDWDWLKEYLNTGVVDSTATMIDGDSTASIGTDNPH